MTVLDLGANRGRFSEVLSEHFPGSYHAVEANPALADELRQKTFLTVRNCAVTARRSRVALHVAVNDEASSLLTLPSESRHGGTELTVLEVEGVPLSDIVDALPSGDIDVVKVDIEGAEIAALPQLSSSALARIVQLSVEFHSDEAFGFAVGEQTARTIAAIKRMGFLRLEFAPGHMDVLFVNRARLQISSWRAFCWRMTAATRRWPQVIRRAVGRRKRAFRRQ